MMPVPGTVTWHYLRAEVWEMDFWLEKADRKSWFGLCEGHWLESTGTGRLGFQSL